MRHSTIYELKEEGKPAKETDIPWPERKNRTKKVLNYESPRKRGKTNSVKCY